ncbi:protein unzipped [Panulirus ornatus]|uniref:protein unzipped n=1 Tax=Panulirus ornatus TaxID=150431 RepID=UPI003A8906D1
MGADKAETFALRVCMVAAALGGALASLEMAKIRREGGSTITSSTLAWIPGNGGALPPHAVLVTEDDPATVWCRAERHSTWLAGAMHAGTCIVPFLGSVLHIEDNFEILISVNGSAKVRYEKWDRYLAPPHNAVAAQARRFLAVHEGEDGFPQAGFLAPRERRAHLVAGAKVERVDTAMVLVEDEPKLYDLRAITLDTSRMSKTHEDIVQAEAKLLNPGPSRQHVVEDSEVEVRQLAYWGRIKGTYTGLPATVVSPSPGSEERKLVWGVQNELDSMHQELLEYDLPPGTGVRVKLIGTVRKTEAPYFGTLTAIYEDGSQTSRVIEGLHMDQRLVLLRAEYSAPYFIHNNTELDIPEQTTVLYKSTTTTTTTSTTTTSTTSTTPEPPKMSMVGPEKPKSDSLSTTSQREVVVNDHSGEPSSSDPTMALLAVLATLVVANGP